MAARWIAEGRVVVNGTQAAKSLIVRPGDQIDVDRPVPGEVRPRAEDVPLEIQFEDEHLAVAVKPAGMVTHPAPGNECGTLVNALLGHLGNLSAVGGDLRPGIVHRLDRDTSGLLVVARTDEAHLALSSALARREVARGYIAAVWGQVKADQFTVDAPVGRHPKNRRRMAVLPGGRQARTHFRRLESWPAADLLAVKLDTGRTHQIRVHMLHYGNPLVGDPTYGKGRERGFPGAVSRWASELAKRCGPRTLLHAARLEFHHPLTGQRMEFTSPLPGPLSDALEWARETSRTGG